MAAARGRGATLAVASSSPTVSCGDRAITRIDLSRIDLKTVELRRRTVQQEPRLVLETLQVRSFKNLADLTVDFRHGSGLAGDWTCLAGVNGSGKSSVLPAICLLLLGRRRATELGEERLRQSLRRQGDENRPALLEATLREGDVIDGL